MKILGLQLQAFGPFTDLSFDFTQGNQGLHILFGPNEAGKSSALRAIYGLLYGIPRYSSDNFRHDYPRLRIGGRLLHSDGSVLEFFRRKGDKNSLLGPDEKPLDGPVLDKFLRGIDERFFANVFGIDYEALVRGGDEILHGRGEVGQSLFGAALGGSSLRKILQRFDEEAKGLFLPRGQTQKINSAINEYNNIKRKIQEASLTSRQWSEADETLKRISREVSELQKRMQHLDVEKTRLERFQKALPKIARRKSLLEKLEELGEVVVLPPEFPQNRREFMGELKTAGESKRKAEENLERLKGEIGKLVVPDLVLTRSDAITTIYKDLGSHQKAAKDRIKLHGNHQQLLDDATRLLAHLRPGLDMETAGQLRPSVILRTRLQELANQHQSLVQALERAKKDVQRTEKELLSAREERQVLEAPRNPEELKRSLKRVQKQGDLISNLAQLHRELASVEEKARMDLKKLDLWSGPLEGLEAMAIPPAETLERFDREFQELSSQIKRLEEKINDTLKDSRDTEQKIEELRLAGIVPSEEELADARERREAGWNLVRRAWIDREDISREEKSYDPANALPVAYEKSVGRADEIADRLRWEANRVTENAALITRQIRFNEDLQRLRKERETLLNQAQQTEEEWIKLWEPLNIKPMTPREMNAWTAKHSKLMQRVERLREVRNESEQISQRINKSRSDLNDCLENLHEKGASEGETLDELCDRSQGLLDKIEEINRKRQDLESKIERLQRDLENFQKEWQEAAAKSGKWEKQWKEAMSQLDLDEKVSPSEAITFFAKLEELFNKLDEAHGIELRIFGIDRDAAEFAGAVKELALAIAPELTHMPVEQAASELNVRLGKAKESQVSLTGLKKQVREQNENLREAEVIINVMSERLNLLCQQAGCSDYGDLPAIEERSLRYQSLQKDIDALEEQLLELTGGATLEQLVEEAGKIEADSLPNRIKEISEQLTALQEERSGLDKKIGELQLILKQMDGSAKAAEAAEEAQEHLATIRAGVDRYLRLKMASIILRKEIERYREKNQGWLLSRASDLFSSLTLGSFTSLQTDFIEGDEPVLQGVRPSGERVGVGGMSDGTRDQLYLSLRLAVVEKYLETNEPIPFIVDDILIKFDDERALATLRMLGELSSKTQIIFFSHHSRLAELARQVSCPGGVYIYSFDK